MWIWRQIISTSTIFYIFQKQALASTIASCAITITQFYMNSSRWGRWRYHYDSAGCDIYLVNSSRSSMVAGCDDWLAGGYFSRGKLRKKRRTKERVGGVGLRDHSCSHLPDPGRPRHDSYPFSYFMLILISLNSIYGDWQKKWDKTHHYTCLEMWDPIVTPPPLWRAGREKRNLRCMIPGLPRHCR